MATEGVEIGTGYISVVPSAQGFMGKLQGQVAPAFANVGDDGGKTMGKGITGGLGGIAAGAGKLLAPIGAALTAVEVGKFFGDAIEGARESEKVAKTTEAVIKSTGGAAKVTADQVGELAGSLAAKTGVDDEVIQSGANLLLTFKNVRNEVGEGNNVFDRATKAAVDMSAAGFGSVEGASKTLGKALNDPLKGISALSRAGVTFSEDQKKAIEKMVETGDVLGAQKMIMQEVESQVGGVAEANGLASEKMAVAWGNFQEDIGAKILPVLDTFQMFMVDTVLPAATQAANGIEGLFKLIFEGDYTGALAGIFGWEEDHPLIGFILDLRQGFLDLFDPMNQAKGPMAGISDGAKGIGDALSGMWTVVSPILQDLLNVIMTKWVEIEPTVTEIFNNVRVTVEEAMTVIQAIIKFVTDAIAIIWSTWGDNIKQQIGITMDTIGGIFKGASDIIRGIWETLSGLLTGDTQKARDGIERIFGGMKGILESIFGGIVATIGNVWDGIKKAFAGPVDWVIDNVINPLIDAVNDLGRMFGVSLNLAKFGQMGGGGGGGGTARGNQRAMAAGGILDGFRPYGAGDDQLVMMRSGEGATVSEALANHPAANYERNRLLSLNSAALSGNLSKFYKQWGFQGYAGGGIIGDTLSNIKSFATNIVTSNPFIGLKSMIDRLKDGVLQQLGSNAITRVLAQLPPMLGEMAVKKLESSMQALFGMGFDRTGGWPPARMGALSPNTAAAVQFVRQSWGINNIGTVGSRPNKSDHPMGKALDIMIPGWAAPGGIAQGNNIARWFVSNPAAFGTKLVIWRDQYNRGSGWRPYTHPNGPTKNPTLRHMDHVHVSVFDEGGWMQPGWGYNALKKPEPVFSPGQWDILKGGLVGDGRVINHNNIKVQVNADDLDQVKTVVDLFKALELEALMTGEEV